MNITEFIELLETIEKQKDGERLYFISTNKLHRYNENIIISEPVTSLSTTIKMFKKLYEYDYLKEFTFDYGYVLKGDIYKQTLSGEHAVLENIEIVEAIDVKEVNNI